MNKFMAWIRMQLPFRNWSVWEAMSDLQESLLHVTAFPDRTVFGELRQFLRVVAEFEDLKLIDQTVERLDRMDRPTLAEHCRELQILIHSAGRGSQKMNRAQIGITPTIYDIWLGNATSGLTSMPLSDVLTVASERAKEQYAFHARQILDAHREPMIDLCDRIKQELT